MTDHLIGRLKQTASDFISDITEQAANDFRIGLTHNATQTNMPERVLDDRELLLFAIAAVHVFNPMNPHLKDEGLWQARRDCARLLEGPGSHHKLKALGDTLNMYVITWEGVRITAECGNP